MTKKLISILISLSVAAASFTAFAYDLEKGAPNFMVSHESDFETSQEVEERRDELLFELIGSYDYTEEEALEVLEDFKKYIDDKSGKTPEDGDNNDNNQGENTEPEVKVITDEVMAKKAALEQLEIIKGESFDYNTGARRDAFAGYTADMINYGEDYSTEEGYFKFSDVTEENEKYHAIANLINKGAIVGVGEGLYKPEDSITVSANTGGETEEKKERHNNIPIAELQMGDVLTAYVSDGVINRYRVHAHRVGEKLSDGDLDYGLYDTGNTVLNPKEYYWLQYAYTVKGKVIKEFDNTYFFVDTKNPYGIYRRVIINYIQGARDMVMIYDVQKKTMTEAISSDIRVGDYMISFRNQMALIVRNYE